jgi:hypothetical protein
MRGTTLKVYVDTVERISVTHGTLTAAEKAGVWFFTSSPSDSVGGHITSISGDDTGAGGTSILRQMMNYHGGTP